MTQEIVGKNDSEVEVGKGLGGSGRSDEMKTELSVFKEVVSIRWQFLRWTAVLPSRRNHHFHPF